MKRKSILRMATATAVLAAIGAAEARRSDLIDGIDLRVVRDSAMKLI